MIPVQHCVGWILVLLLVSCNPATVEEQVQPGMPPDSLIAEPQMVLMLADAHLIEAALLIARNRGENISGVSERLYLGLYQKYGVSHARYLQNLSRYQQDPDLHERLYTQVIQELANREAHYVKTKPR